MARTPKPWFRKDRGCWFVTIDGERHNLGPDQDAATQRFHELMAQPQKRVVPSHSLVAMIDLFLEWLYKHRARETYEASRYRLERFAQKYPSLLVTELKPFHVQQWVDSYDFSSTSQRNYVRSVKRCLNWAVQQGYLEHNPIAMMQAPAAEHRETVVSEEEYARILSVVTDDALKELIVVSWETGCRPQESLRVESRHVDRIHKRWVFPKSESKNKRLARVVYLTDAAMAITEKRMLLFPEGPLFRNATGVPWTTEAVNCGFRRIRSRIGQQLMGDRKMSITEAAIRQEAATLKREKTEKGKTRLKTKAELRREAKTKLQHQTACGLVPNYCLYALRHSWATHALQHGVDPLTVAILMGHSDPSMLAKVYQHLSLNPDHLKSQLKKAVGPSVPASIHPERLKA